MCVCGQNRVPSEPTSMLSAIELKMNLTLAASVSAELQLFDVQQ